MATEMRFWGWGEDARAGPAPAAALAWLERELGGLDEPPAPPALGDVRVGASALPRALAERFGAILRDDPAARVLHGRGKSYPDLIRQRAGDALDAPDAVLAPRTHDEVSAVLQACAAGGVAVVPFGGGTSVVGGLEPLRGAHGALVSLDLGALDAIALLDERSQVAVVGAGLRVAALEAHVRERGLTLGHFPQSFEYVSAGGCAATRSAGQASTGYGRFDELVQGVRLAAPAGDLDLPPRPASAAGPELRQLVVGSEGVLGAITEVALALRAAPEYERYEGWMFASFEAGAETLRTAVQAGAAPDVGRLSDAAETRSNLAMADVGRVAETVLRGYLKARRVDGGCLAIVGWEGTEETVRARRAATAEHLRAGGGAQLGQAVGRAWQRSRFAGPYVRDHLMDRGVFVETIETATIWANLHELHHAVGEALAAHAALVGCHLSHLYRTGASLYFTFLDRARRGEEIEQWRAAKIAALDAIVRAGGTITHHHAVGVDHVPWMAAEVGETGLGALRALKAQLDPAGVMNPGKLLP